MHRYRLNPVAPASPRKQWARPKIPQGVQLKNLARRSRESPDAQSADAIPALRSPLRIAGRSSGSGKIPLHRIQCLHSACPPDIPFVPGAGAAKTEAYALPAKQHSGSTRPIPPGLAATETERIVSRWPLQARVCCRRRTTQRSTPLPVVKRHH